MPGPLIALWLIWAGAGTALLGPPAIWRGSDPMVQQARGAPKQARISYRLWLASPRRERDGSCAFTAFAMVSRERLTRLQIGAVEQIVDWSWSWEIKAAERETATASATFIDPVSRATTERSVAAVCWPGPAPRNKWGVPLQ